MPNSTPKRRSRFTSSLISAALAAVLFAMAGSRSADTRTLTLRLIDAESGRQIPGVIQIENAGGERIPLPELLSRGTGLRNDDATAHWSVLTSATRLSLPKEALTLRAFSGLETELATIELDSQASGKMISIPVRRFGNASHDGWVAGNTHLHLQKISRAQADRYLREVPQADNLKILFVSYLERAVADAEYISNEYRREDLQRLSEGNPTQLGNGEEHRHNYGSGGEGYGHVMLLDISQLVLPVSIGPGIMQMGTDGIPLQRGIDQSRRDGGTVLWCHNSWGFERIPNFVGGRIDAQNIFDGGNHGSYEDSFYPLLEAGLNPSFSTGTDWFIYDFSRVYCRLGSDVTIENWLAALKRGETFITNGPLLTLKLDGRGPGEMLELKQPGKIVVEASAAGRLDFRRIELVQNDEVVKQAASRKANGHFVAEMNVTLDVTEPSWFALRIPSPAVRNDAPPEERNPLNEYGRQLFAHTGAVRVAVDGKHRRVESVVRNLLEQTRSNRKRVASEGKFADDQERARVLDVYNAAIETLEEDLAK